MRIAEKLKEHYGIEVPASTCWQIVLRHAQAMESNPKTAGELPDRAGVAQLIVEIDGSMIPVVATGEPKADGEKIDRRKTRTVGWKEARLNLAHEPGSVTPVFGATLGTTEEAGEEMFRSAVRAGAGLKTKMHCVGDGAAWIFDQVDLRFGPQADFLVDFYHLCEYLAPAGKKIAGGNNQTWMETQKQLLKENRSQEVLEGLRPFLEDDKVCDSDAAVRVAYRYMTNRPG
ncbi:MAG: ISKra4-like element ISTvi1 family transposase, partial [Acidimicrobiia bacterium]